MAVNIESKKKLLSGYEIPILGYGVYQTPSDITTDVCLKAIEAGYRHIDSAHAYKNEEPCATAIRKSGLDRSSIFFTSKVPPKAQSYETAKQAIQESFDLTGLEYIDLYLIHAPYGGRAGRLGVWDALLEFQRAGKIRSLGVSNYGVDHLDELEAHIKELDSKKPGSGGKISVGQWELHPWLTRPDIVEWCQKRDVVLEAYCPIVRGQRFDDPQVQKMVKKYGKEPAQILLRWSLQKGFVPLPKSVTPSRIVSNADLYDFELSAEDMEALTTTEYSPCSWDPTTSGLEN